MSIRYKIGLWVAAAGLASTLLLSLIILFDKIEKPYELLDEELKSQAHSVASILMHNVPQHFSQALTPIGDHYWIRLLSDENEILFESPMVALIELPLLSKTKPYNIETEMMLGDLIPTGDEDDLAAFRMRYFPLYVGNDRYFLHIGRPQENLVKEIREQVHMLVFGLLISFFSLIVMSYFVAGKILKPVREINKKIHEINDQTLDQRLTLPRSRDELYELSVSLNTMFDRLQYSFDRQKEFVANASHELKTPLAILRLSMEENLQYDDVPEALQRNLVAHCHTLLRLSRLVEKLLSLSALEYGDKKGHHTFSLQKLTQEVVDEFELLVVEKDITITKKLEQDVRVTGSKEQIQQVLINLLDNGIKYNNEGGFIKLDLYHDNEMAHLKIYNTGPGIPEHDQLRVFEQFYRVEKSRSIALGGAGLGLTIVKKIIDLHSGKIHLSSQKGQWTEVIVSLPRAKD
ncbi:MAG: sensor histidine kinase [Desulfobulbaceae bacterium]|nr:MAG: sensor histidine kinase [Desulfobulbaceae bacterium]